MKTIPISARPRKLLQNSSGLADQLAERVVGQPDSIAALVPYVQMFQAGLAPEGRPVGVFLLLGPTGTGKTRTVEALAEVLHGSERMLVKVDCGEFQMEHEVAKLIGAPPGYLGHRETQPILTQAKLNTVSSDQSSLSIVLFDEIEKSAPSLTRLLLGVLDKAVLRLGDNSSVNFERSLIFLTSNLGARAMSRELRPDFGFESIVPTMPGRGRMRKLESIALRAARKRFSPEFINRIDRVVTYQPLHRSSLECILDQQINRFQQLVHGRLGPRAFSLDVSKEARAFLIEHGTSAEYGARELKRTMHRHLIQPLAAQVATGAMDPGSLVRVVVEKAARTLAFEMNSPPLAHSATGTCF